jgi:signal transduction histidine kinase
MPAGTGDDLSGNDQWGLSGMRERAAAMGATLSIGSPGLGTTVSLAVPLNRLRRRADHRGRP